MTKLADDEAGRQEMPERVPATSPEPHSPDTADVHTYIGARLRKAFDDVARQPVPERFLQLMRELDQS